MAVHDDSRFLVEILEWDEVHTLPSDWGPESLRSLLELAEIDDVAEIDDADLADMASMALQDLELREACDLTLRVVFGDGLSAGLRQNLIDDLQDDLPWEQFADPTKQGGIFTSVVLLQQAFPARFGKPDAARVRLRVKPLDAEAREQCRKGIHPSLIVRLLAAGMPDSAILRRLYGEGLAGSHFREATAILWQHRVLPEDTDPKAGPWTLEVHSSLQWLGPLEDVEPYEATAWADAPDPDPPSDAGGEAREQ